MCVGLPFLPWEMKSGPATTSFWWCQGGGGVVPTMAATGKVDRGALEDRVEAWDGGMAWPTMWCGTAGDGRSAGMLDRYHLNPHRLCGRTAQNMHTFRGVRLPPDTKHPKSSLHWTDSIEHTPRENSNNPRFSSWMNNENEFTILTLFHITRVLRNTLLQY